MTARQRSVSTGSSLPEFKDVTVSTLKEFEKFPVPIVISPDESLGAEGRSLEFLTKFCKQNQKKITELLTAKKVILFRGFAVKTPQDFEAVALQVENKLNNEYLGTSPRNFVKDTTYIFTASELPNFFPIPQHIEMSFLKSRPNKVFFFCEREPATGGQTPIADCAAVYRDMDPVVREKFEKKGVRYVRNYVGPKEWTIDPTQLKRWPEIFGTTDKKAVEATCQREEVKLEWKKNDGIRISNNMPGALTHPVTGEKIWCNHSATFHPAMAHQEYLRIARYQNKWRFYLWAALAFFLFAVKTIFKQQRDFPLNTLYGDGTPIPSSDMTKVRDAIWRNTVFNKWRQGDIYVIDNAAASHGRMPYTGTQRRILVAWG